MKPIIFPPNETAFQTNGLGRIDPIKCIVTEERNGQFELEMDYPISGEHYGDIALSRIICAVPADGKDPQPFRASRHKAGASCQRIRSRFQHSESVR